jgi:hypothetical protein
MLFLCLAPTFSNASLSPTGEPEPEITWYKGDTEIKPKKKDKKYKIDWDVTTDVSSLVIKDAGSEDAGEYKVKATNAHGTSESVVTVEIKEKESKKKKAKLVAKTEVTEEQEEQKAVVIEGQTATESETAEKKGISVKGKTETESEEAVADKLELKSKVGAEEVEEKIEEKKAEVEKAAPKQEKPVFDVSPESVTANEGEEIKLTCKVKGTSTFFSFMLIDNRSMGCI